jgi:hypothetical protein
MTRKILNLFSAPILALAFTLPAPLALAQAITASGRFENEVAAQKLLPKVHDPLWTQLVKCDVSYNNKNGAYSIKITPEVQTLDGKTVTLRGFMLPLDASDRTSHFLLTRNTPVCLYCPPGEPNEVVEVTSSRGIEWTKGIVTVTGKLDLIKNDEQALFFKIEASQAK